MPQIRFTVRLMMIAVAILALLLGGFVLVLRAFGLPDALRLSLLLTLPLVVAVRLGRRWPAEWTRDLAYLAILLCLVLAVVVLAIRDVAHREGVKWAKFEGLIRQDPAFRNVRIRVTDLKDIHWAEGTVTSEEDLARLRLLASRCGINQRLDGPYQYSVSLTVDRGEVGVRPGF